MKRIVQLIMVLVISVATMSAQGVWKGFDMTRTTDAFQMEVPVGTTHLIVNEHEAKQKFGKIEEGPLKSSKEYEFDDKGYFIADGEKEYRNTYNSNGLIEQRDIYKNGKLYNRWVYKYMYDNKGPAVGVEIYNGDGDIEGGKVWQGDLYYSTAPGGDVKYKLNKKGREIEGTITVTNYRDKVQIHQTNTYNNHGYPESKIIYAPGRSQTTEYSNYVYNNNGIWIQRYSDDGKLTKRQFLSKEEYYQLQQEKKKRAEEENRKKRLEEISQQTRSEKREIAERGYAWTDDLYALPTVKVDSVREVILSQPVKFKTIVGDRPQNIEVGVKEYKDGETLFSIEIEKSAEYKFYNDSIGIVNSLFIGTVSSEFLRKKGFSTPMEVKVDFNKKTQEWYIKNGDKISSKYNLSDDEIQALTQRVVEKGRVEPYKQKSLYFSGLFQLKVTVESSEGSAVKCKKSEVFPIRFLMINSDFIKQQKKEKRAQIARGIASILLH